MESFWKEIVTLAAVAQYNFPNVFRFFGVVLTDGAPRWMVTELANENLESMLSRGGLNAESVRHVLRDVLTGLRDLGSVNVLHRDIKPANVLVFREGSLGFVCKLGDVGEGVVATGPVADGGTATAASLVGSPFFRAPEMVSGARYTASVDVFSFGMLGIDVVLRVLAVGGKAVVADPSRTYTTARRKEGVLECVARLQMVWPGLGRVLRGCTEEDPGRRWSAEQALVTLNDLKVVQGAGLACVLMGASQCAAAVALRATAATLSPLPEEAEGVNLARRLVLAGCLPPMFHAMNEQLGVVLEQILGLQILGLLSEGSDEDNERAIVEAGLPCIFAAMDAHATVASKPYLDVVSHAFSALTNLTLHQSNCTRLVEAGVLDRLYAAMAARVDFSDFQSTACRLMGNLVRGVASVAEVVRATGALDLLSVAIERHGLEPDVQLSVMWALWNIHCTPLDAPFIALAAKWSSWDATLDIMGMDLHLGRVQEFALWAMYSLSTADDRHMVALQGDRRVTRAIQHAMEAHASNERVMEAAVIAVAVLDTGATE